MSKENREFFSRTLYELRAGRKLSLLFKVRLRTGESLCPTLYVGLTYIHVCIYVVWRRRWSIWYSCNVFWSLLLLRFLRTDMKT